MKKSCYYCVHKTDSVTSEVCLRCCRKTDEYGNADRSHGEFFDVFSPTNSFISRQLEDMELYVNESIKAMTDTIVEHVNEGNTTLERKLDVPEQLLRRKKK